MKKLDFADARHLVARTGIGMELKSVKALVDMPINLAVDRLLGNRNSHPPPFLAKKLWRHISVLREDQKRKGQLMHVVRDERKGLQTWWANHLLTTRAPLVERMTLFWHNMFPSTMTSVKSADLLYQQNVMLRRHALGSFRNLLHAVAKDPAMLVYLDGYKNVKGQYNENFAREVLELFTVGGGYSEKDIHNAARAFTGWTVNVNGHFFNNIKEHDLGQKIILGRSGRHTGEQALNIMLRQRRTAERVVKRMWAEFVSVAHPNPRAIHHWTNGFIRSDYNISTLLKIILTSNEFWAASNRGALIKSPIDLVIGTLRTLPYTLTRNDLAHQLSLLGQGLFEHSSVKGWAGAEEWVSPQTLLLRQSLLKSLARGRLGMKSGVGQKLSGISEDDIVLWLLAIPALGTITKNGGKQRLVRELILDPAYQVL